MPLPFTLRQETEADRAEIDFLTREAFYNLYVPGCDEHYLSHIMVEHPDFWSELCFVAELDGQIVGSIRYTRSSITDENGRVVPTATFGPLCVHPDHQRCGMGGALIQHTKQLLQAQGYPAIIILGDPHNYCKHGFKTGKDYGVSMRDGSYPMGLLVLELKDEALAGHSWTFHESEVYDLAPGAAEEYDAQLPPKEKKSQYSQELYSMQCRAMIV